ncbi:MULTISPECIES: hypothetical protein [Xanthomonas]|uniref:DUF1453 domain-containing protein n=1 Tax=Xanthomonas cucurbitae TaxID=56453 RepID=A0ABY7YC42_9XANT|nr:hypothetical protein [Xanthomonas cucurbitae]QHG85697.1 hypothetical protein EBN15_00505 [Xanthomonas cucurbitae]WDM67572.1 hypothetical protein K6981_19335 [Xanthomonas cucurbitae]WDM71448.1 hypothetical protein K6978_19300 [Xanthomonas cucurbitae]WDM75576.1 hypothetical protein K6982_00480 [Xanthomonas cucurbitae]
MPAHAIAPFMPYLSMAAIGLLYYRRIRRSFGRQPWKPLATGVRVAALLILAAALGFALYGLPQVRLGIAVGALAGSGLGALSLRYTHAEWREGRGWYTPNPWIGAALMLVLLGRLAWRWATSAFATGAAAAGSQASPLTLGIAAALVLYALVHIAGLWWRLRQLRLQAGPVGAAR